MLDTLTTPNNSLSHLFLFGLFYIGLYGDLPPPSLADKDNPSNTTISVKTALLS